MSTTPKLTPAQEFRMSLVFTAFMLLFSGSGLLGLSEDAKRATYKEVQGKMVSIHQFTGFRKASKARVPQLVTEMEYSYQYDNKPYLKKEESEWISDTQAQDKYAVGKTLVVFVDPNDPTQATLEEGRDAGTDKITLGITSLAALIGVGVNLFLFQKMRSADQNP